MMIRIVSAQYIPGAGLYPWESFTYGDAKMTLMDPKDLITEVKNFGRYVYVTSEGGDQTNIHSALIDALTKIPNGVLVAFKG